MENIASNIQKTMFNNEDYKHLLNNSLNTSIEDMKNVEDMKTVEQKPLNY